MHSTAKPEVAKNPREAGVPLLDLGRQYSTLKQQIGTALLRVCDSGAFVLGPDVAELETSVAAYCGAGHAVGCASGSDALLLALMAFEIGPGDEVILPSFTFFATASAITRLGATPVFADIDPVTFNIDPKHVEQLVGPATKAILPVHLFGQCAEMGAIRRIADAGNFPVIEDAAQAIGAQLDGRSAGSIGDVGCFSFYPTKNLGGAGDGGMLTCRRDDLADKLRLLRTHGMRPRYHHKVVGINSRLDSFQAAVLNVKLPYLDHWTALRQTNARRYSELFAEAGLDRVLGLPVCIAGRRHVWNQYVIRVPEGKRDALRQFLAEAKIGAEIYYPMGLHEQECFSYLGHGPADLPETHRATREVLALPIFPELTEREQQFVVERVAAFFHKATGGRSTVMPTFSEHTAAHAAPGSVTG
ncbi:MAG: DegT/DnrJ/EryC1/StrS family aminotransferase [Planctomycetes bacterium]|nr:DegT/DnrJ/EryC1/StrS family aminotransferase [Planctomycetota bacterium]